MLTVRKHLQGARGSIYAGSFFSLYRVLTVVLRVLRVIGPRQMARRPVTGLKVLVCGRVDSLNWCRAHLLPLANSAMVAQLLAVIDGEVIPHPKICVPVGSWMWLTRLLPRSFVRTLRCLEVAIAFKPDIVIGYSFLPATIGALLAAKLSGALAVYQMCGGPAELANGGLASDAPDQIIPPVPQGWRPSLERAALAICDHLDGIVIRGKKAQEYLNAHSIHKHIAIIPGSVEQRRFASETIGRKYDIAFLGRFVQDKQPHLLVDIAAELLNKQLCIRCVFAGTGPLFSATVTRAQNLGIQDSIEFPGKLENPETLLRATKIFLLTSRSEGLSIALAEAMTAGAVPVVSNVGDLAELVQDGVTGYLVTPGQITDFAKRIEQLLKSSELWGTLSNNARSIAIRNNSSESVTRKWNSYFSDLIHSPGPICVKKRDRGPRSSIVRRK